MPGVRKVYTHANIGLADFQAFPMMPAELNRPVLARDRKAELLQDAPHLRQRKP